MASWSLSRVNYLPLLFGVLLAVGLVTCYVVAVLRGDVSPYVPFISETGGNFPEAGLFSLFLYFCSTVALSTTLVRFLIVSELNRAIDRAIDICNIVSLVIGVVAQFGMLVVAAFPMTSIAAAHNTGALVLFVSGTVYGCLQTWLSYRMSPYYNGLLICRVRLAITIVGVAAIVSMIALQPFAFGQWASASHEHWTGSKMPKDQGFDLLLATAIAEWVMAFAFLAYYLSFVREFAKVSVHVRLQLLVQHFDDHPDDVLVANERSPIVM